VSQEDDRSPISELIKDFRDGRLGRREFLRQVVIAGVSSAAAYALLGQATAEGQVVTTYAVGEEATPVPQPQRPAGPVTTQAVGEETSSPQVTTYAVGEESNPPRMTTQAIGEESNPPPMTTQAVGEESRPPMTTLALGEETHAGAPTTRAIGEEMQPRRPSGYWPPGLSPSQRPSLWRNWQRW
jgi:hypothetical protein